MNPLIASPAALPDPRNPETHRIMLALAERLLAGREAHVVAIIDKGEPVSSAAETSVRLGRALVDQWRWVVDDNAGELPHLVWPNGWWGAWQQELAADTVTAADRARQRAASGDPDAIETAELCEVLAWYQHMDHAYLSRIVNAVDLDRYCADRAVERREAA